MADVKETLAQNPVTTVAAVGAVVALVGGFVGWDAEVQLRVLQGVLGAALLVRLAVASVLARKT